MRPAVVASTAAAAAAVVAVEFVGVVVAAGGATEKFPVDAVLATAAAAVGDVLL